MMINKQFFNEILVKDLEKNSFASLKNIKTFLSTPFIYLKKYLPSGVYIFNSNHFIDFLEKLQETISLNNILSSASNDIKNFIFQFKNDEIFINKKINNIYYGIVIPENYEDETVEKIKHFLKAISRYFSPETFTLKSEKSFIFAIRPPEYEEEVQLFENLIKKVLKYNLFYEDEKEFKKYADRKLFDIELFDEKIILNFHTESSINPIDIYSFFKNGRILPAYKKQYLIIYPEGFKFIKQNAESLFKFLKLTKNFSDSEYLNIKTQIEKIVKKWKINYSLNFLYKFPDKNKDDNPTILNELLKFKEKILSKKEIFNKDISPYDYQIIGMHQLLKNKYFILGDKMGLGKTLQTIYALFIEELSPALIISPATLKYNQVYEINKYLNENYLNEKVNITILKNAYKKDEKTLSFLKNIKNKEDKINIIIINYDILKDQEKLLKGIPFKVIIADEAHYLKNKGSKRSKAFESIIKTVKPEYLWLLTGTPIMNKPTDLLNLLSYMNFYERYYITKKNFLSLFFWQKKTQWAVEFNIKYNKTKDLYEVLRETVYLGRRKEDVLKFLPEKSVNLILLDFEDISSAKAQKEYKKLKEEVVKNISKIGAEVEKIENDKKKLNQLKFQSVSEINKIRQLLSKIKAEYAVKQVENFLEENPEEKIVVFAYFKDTQKYVYEKLSQLYPNKVLKLVSETNLKERQEVIKQFQEDNSKQILIVSLMAGKEGITLTAANSALFIDLDYIPSNLQQAEDRIHRISQKRNVNIYYMIIKNTIDEQVYNKLKHKVNLIDVIIENSSEVLKSI